ncbi:hypothetical protein PG996_015235 [Apiospora saccharicola]|uniref:Uncharacterized protein n=1 Tax=Apiospora saccharicola TaxID=335842 RepID=A0ABR1TKK0_9PEZI
MRARDDETFPETTADVREGLVTILERVRLEHNHVVLDVLHESFGQSIGSQLRTPEELRLILPVFLSFGTPLRSRVALEIIIDPLSGINGVARLIVGLHAVLLGIRQGSATTKALVSI